MLCMEKKVGGLHLFVCKNYISLTCLNGFFAIFNFDNILIKSNIFIWSLFQHANNSKKTNSCLDFKNQGKNPPKQESLVFLETTVHRVGETAEKPTKNQGEIQVSRKPSVLVGFLRQNKDWAYPLSCYTSVCLHRDLSLVSKIKVSRISGCFVSFDPVELKLLNRATFYEICRKLWKYAPLWETLIREVKPQDIARFLGLKRLKLWFLGWRELRPPAAGPPLPHEPRVLRLYLMRLLHHLHHVRLFYDRKM